MADRAAFIVLATGSEDGGPVHCRGWRIAAESVDVIAESMNGEPLEWIWDDTDSPDHPRVLFGEGGSRQLLARTIERGQAGSILPPWSPSPLVRALTHRRRGTGPRSARLAVI